MLETVIFYVMTKAIKIWVNRYMDQFELFKFKCNYGYTTYVTISFHSEYPDGFVDLDTRPATLVEKEQ